MIVLALTMGLVGSMHCVGMCGPLLLLMQSKDKTSSIFYTVLYHAGRIMTYVVLGLVMAAFGEGLRLVGVQQYISLVLGVLILFFIFFARNPEQVMFRKLGLDRLTDYLRKGYSKVLQRNAFMGKFILGTLNGLLPCGLVYSVLLLTVSAESTLDVIGIMFAFGLGTLPALFALNVLNKLIKIRFQPLFQYSMLFVGVLLILRGANLNIPYISPSVGEKGVKCSCH